MKLPAHYPSLSPSERRAVRGEYVRVQNGGCALCKKPLSEPPAEKTMKASINEALFPPEFFKHPVHLHHDHKTGMTEGAVHARCNAFLWQYLGQ